MWSVQGRGVSMLRHLSYTVTCTLPGLLGRQVGPHSVHTTSVSSATGACGWMGRKMRGPTALRSQEHKVQLCNDVAPAPALPDVCDPS